MGNVQTRLFQLNNGDQIILIDRPKPGEGYILNSLSDKRVRIYTRRGYPMKVFIRTRSFENAATLLRESIKEHRLERFD